MAYTGRTHVRQSGRHRLNDTRTAIWSDVRCGPRMAESGRKYRDNGLQKSASVSELGRPIELASVTMGQFSSTYPPTLQDCGTL